MLYLGKRQKANQTFVREKGHVTKVLPIGYIESRVVKNHNKSATESGEKLRQLSTIVVYKAQCN
jgi:hypothetical protein